MIFDGNSDSLESYQGLCSIKVIGAGGAGNNAVNHMIINGIDGVEFWVANTDVQILSASSCNNRIILGETITKGLGAGADPKVGREAALESEAKIREALEGADMIFIAAGMGGGTGTGAAPVIARIAKEIGALTIGVVTRPFTFEGKTRSFQAGEGIQALKEYVDSLIIISNDRLLQMNGAIPLKESFQKADQVLGRSVSTITDLITTTGYINCDFADVKNVMLDKGIAMIGFGSASGPNKVTEATNKAISSPLLEASFSGAKNAIVNIYGGNTLSLFDVNDIIEIITEAAGGEINVILGASQDDSLNDELKVAVIATDFDESKITYNVPFKRPRNTEIRQETLDLGQNEEIKKNKEEDLIPDFLKQEKEKNE